MEIMPDISSLLSLLWEIKAILLAVFLTAFSGWISFHYKKKENRSDGKPNDSNRWAFILLILGTMLTIYSGWTSNSEKKKAEADKVIADNKVDSVNDLITRKEKVIETLQHDQIDSTISVLKGQIEILKQITGDNNIPKISGEVYSQYKRDPSRDSSYDSSLVVFHMINDSKYSISGIQVSFHEFFNADTWVQKYYTIDIGDLAPKTTKEFNNHNVSEFKWPKHQQYDYEYTVSWTRGQYTGYFSFQNRKDTSRYVTKSEITHMTIGGKVK